MQATYCVRTVDLGVAFDAKVSAQLTGTRTDTLPIAWKRSPRSLASLACLEHGREWQFADGLLVEPGDLRVRNAALPNIASLGPRVLAVASADLQIGV